MMHWHDQFQHLLDGEVQTGPAGAPEAPAAPGVSQDAQAVSSQSGNDRTQIGTEPGEAAACIQCAAGKEVFGGGCFGPPFHALESRDDEGCLFTECPLQRDRWLAEQKIREIALELYAALRSLHSAVGQLPENAHGVMQGDDLNRAYGVAGNVLAKATE